MKCCNGICLYVYLLFSRISQTVVRFFVTGAPSHINIQLVFDMFTQMVFSTIDILLQLALSYTYWNSSVITVYSLLNFVTVSMCYEDSSLTELIFLSKMMAVIGVKKSRGIVCI